MVPAACIETMSTRTARPSTAWPGNLYGGVETFMRTLAECRALSPNVEHEFALCYDGRLADELRAPGRRSTRSAGSGSAGPGRVAGASGLAALIRGETSTWSSITPAGRRCSAGRRRGGGPGGRVLDARHDRRAGHWADRLAARTSPTWPSSTAIAPPRHSPGSTRTPRSRSSVTPCGPKRSTGTRPASRSGPRRRRRP